ncbi:unnamed protein product [Toxocara canis]|uniref:Nuclear receptor domain-containing protein n=1 Tax=Toxocara canis TaxID=6265 RepID=A0A183UAN5_TOXCA|nr:unnamed protein product [Toxocara canis]
MPPPFTAQNFPAPSFIDVPHSHPPPAHQNTDSTTTMSSEKLLRDRFKSSVLSYVKVIKGEAVMNKLDSDNSGSTTPSPLNQPTSPSFGAPANLVRFSMFSEPVGGSSSGLQATASSETFGEDKLCAVCSDRAVCQHYGARTCEGCKGFFKRTVQKKAQYVCTGNKNCTIDKRFRSRCQYCRFQKCIAVGMVKEVVRYGSLSGRRGRLPSKTKLVHSDDPPSPPLPLLTLINKAYSDSKTVTEGFTTFGGTVEQLLMALDEEFRSFMHFVEKIPGSSEISQADTITLIEQNFFALLALKLSPFKLLFAEIHEEAIRFNRIIQWDPSSFAALFALQFLNRSESPTEPLSSEAAADRLRGTITSALKDHCCSVSPPHTKKLQTIISQVAITANNVFILILFDSHLFGRSVYF